MRLIVTSSGMTIAISTGIAATPGNESTFVATKPETDSTRSSPSSSLRLGTSKVNGSSGRRTVAGEMCVHLPRVVMGGLVIVQMDVCHRSGDGAHLDCNG